MSTKLTVFFWYFLSLVANCPKVSYHHLGFDFFAVYRSFWLNLYFQYFSFVLCHSFHNLVRFCQNYFELSFFLPADIVESPSKL